MKNNVKSVVIMIITSTILLSLVMIFANSTDIIKSYYEKEIVTDNAILKKNNKIIAKGNIKGTSFGACKYGDEYVVETQIRKNNIKNPVLVFNNYIDSGICVYVDNKKIYEYGMDAPKNSIVCNDNMYIPTYENCSGKMLKLVFRCTNVGVFSNVPEIYYMNSRDAYLQNLKANLVVSIIGITLIGMGLICIALVIFNIGINVTIKQMIYISLISICGGFWMLACYQVLVFFGDSYVVDFYTEYICIYLMLILFNLYVTELYNGQKVKKILSVLKIILFVYSILVFVLQYFNICYMNDVIIVLHILTLPAIYFIIKYYIRKVKMDGKGYVVLCTFGLMSCAFGITYCVLHIIKASINILNLLPILVFFFVVSGMIYSLFEIKKAYATRAEKDALEDLIYIDKLTGINNRRGLDRFDKMIRFNGIHYEYIVYSIDLNKLKFVNDNYGHSAGDNLIKNFANNLKDVVNKNGFCGRIGGDEFIVVIRNEDYEGKFEEVLSKNVDEYNKKSDCEYKLEYSIGSASYKLGGSVTIDESIKVADYNMYEMKIRYHRKDKKNIK